MRAMIQTKYGSPEVIVPQTIAKPSPGDKEIIIRIRAASVGPSDCAFRKGDPFAIKLIYGWSRPKYPIGGCELAGVVEAVGKDVTRFKIGDRVLGMSPKTFGAHAEYKCLPEDSPLAVIPGNIASEDAVAVCDGGATALTFLRDKAKLRQGQQVLINGASGAVGIYAVQLAKFYGAEVTAVCSAGNEGLVRESGADFMIDYTRDDFAKAGKAYDIIFDAVGKRSFSACKRALKSKGVYLTTVPKPAILVQMMWTSLFQGKRAMFAAAGLMQNDANLAFLLELTSKGALNAVIDRRYPLELLPEAHRYVETGRKKGNVVITF